MKKVLNWKMEYSNFSETVDRSFRDIYGAVGVVFTFIICHQTHCEYGYDETTRCDNGRHLNKGIDVKENGGLRLTIKRICEGNKG